MINRSCLYQRLGRSHVTKQSDGGSTRPVPQMSNTNAPPLSAASAYGHGMDRADKMRHRRCLGRHVPLGNFVSCWMGRNQETGWALEGYLRGTKADSARPDRRRSAGGLPPSDCRGKYRFVKASSRLDTVDPRVASFMGLDDESRTS
jgi:hypothetical protein